MKDYSPFRHVPEEEALLFAKQTGESARLTAGIRVRAEVFGKDGIAISFLNANGQLARTDLLYYKWRRVFKDAQFVRCHGEDGGFNSAVSKLPRQEGRRLSGTEIGLKALAQKGLR